MNEEEYASDIIEVGFYAQVLTGGGYVGWNDNSNGLAFGGIHQTSAGVAGYVSGGGVLTSESDGVEWGYNAGGGVAMPTGIPSPVTGGMFLGCDPNSLSC
ncbi:hypothetical protein [Celeribacter baekdonensis]|jgi:hypothetical protein|uniref:hypothetical protein n=1 Tax=Celeribacter baekdonensis TaxID=875171 RepID=UPI0030DD373D